MSCLPCYAGPPIRSTNPLFLGLCYALGSLYYTKKMQRSLLLQIFRHTFFSSLGAEAFLRPTTQHHNHSITRSWNRRCNESLRSTTVLSCNRVKILKRRIASKQMFCPPVSRGPELSAIRALEGSEKKRSSHE